MTKSIMEYIDLGSKIIEKLSYKDKLVILIRYFTK